MGHGEPARPDAGATAVSLRALRDGPGEVLRLVGEADEANRRELVSLLSGIDGGSPTDVRLDLSGLRFIDVAGAAVLLEAADRLGSGRRLVLQDPPTTLCRILTLLWPGEQTIEMEIR
ncbi:MAG TPA: STAS domain-containing protein [Pilimelia sp.]|nr:STAS domain-containing protein [Pilimelia sp.]